MSRPTPVAIADPALPLPDPADRATFTARKLEHLGWERNVLSPGALALAQVAKDNADDANANAIAVAADAVAVAANAALAAGYAGAAPWVSGSTVAQYAVVSSPINRRSYRKLTTSTGGTTDPSLDPTNYELVPIARPIVHVSGTSVTAVPGFHYSLENAGVTTVMLPPSPASEADVQVTAANGRLDNIIARNAQTIGGAASDLVLDVPSIVLKFLNTSWRAST